MELPRIQLAGLGFAGLGLAALGLLGIAGAAAASERPANHVVMISVDGLRPEFYLDPAWPAPMLRQLWEDGSHAEAVRGVHPTVTYPSHTTLITGVLPARHGVYYNTPFEPEGATGRWYWESSSIEARTLWQAAREAGLTTASIGWPVSVGAPVDFNVPEIWSLEADADPVATVRAACRPPDLLAELEREATGRLTRDNFTIDHISHDDLVGAGAGYLLATYKPALFTIHLIETDHFQHEDGRDSRRVRRAVAAVDRAISRIYEAAETAGILERTAFLIVGDHGHVDLHTQLAPNVWMVEAGLQEAVEDRGAWRATFHVSAASAFLHLKDPADRAASVAARTRLERLPPGLRKLFRILEREELDALGAAPDAAFALAPVPGVHFTADAVGEAVRPATGATHGYPPDFPQIHTGFIASGAGIRRGGAVQLLPLESIAPFAAQLLGLDLPEAEGSPPLGFLASGDAP